jgi:ABC-type Fe3+ transport system permease subunit
LQLDIELATQLYRQKTSVFSSCKQLYIGMIQDRKELRNINQRVEKSFEELNQAIAGTGVWQGYWQSLLLSYVVATVVTLLNVVLSLPMAVLIARKRWGSGAATALDVLSNVPLIVPSIALGASMGIFWRNFAFVPEVALIIFSSINNVSVFRSHDGRGYRACDHGP